ncbi:hypothetical protein FGO68_gene12238 [Halteria grandinella]|uniref:Uncharacterized protein n=1 Tax=Halteria grandinella TaxID=5974 RepID=A0A8J8NR55_HALGN|nr:hypothetical protein FGO68_gene12238 [Halteria grandinella]
MTRYRYCLPVLLPSKMWDEINQGCLMIILLRVGKWLRDSGLLFRFDKVMLWGQWLSQAAEWKLLRGLFALMS